MMIVVFARKVVRLQNNYKICVNAKFQSPVLNHALLILAMSDRAKKTVWSKYFDILDKKTSKCTICNKNASAEAGNTINLKVHLLRHHKLEYKECADADAAQAALAAPAHKAVIH